MTLNASRVLALIALVLFALAAVGFSLHGLDIVPAGLAFLAASLIV